MADVAAIFHWTPGDMDGMTVPELMEGRKKAGKRSGADE